MVKPMGFTINFPSFYNSSFILQLKKIKKVKKDVDNGKRKW